MYAPPGQAPLPGQIGYVAPVPVWVYILIPVGAIGLIAMMKKSRHASTAGYRRKHRRSKRRSHR
jgi:hypothetical protein